MCCFVHQALRIIYHTLSLYHTSSHARAQKNKKHALQRKIPEGVGRAVLTLGSNIAVELRALLISQMNSLLHRGWFSRSKLFLVCSVFVIYVMFLGAPYLVYLYIYIWWMVHIE